MIAAALKALEQLFAPEFRSVLVKSLALTIALMAALWFALQALVASFAPFPWPWLETVAGVLAGAGLLVAMIFLIGPVTALFAGLFLDQVAEAVERRYYPGERPGREPPMLRSLGLAARFTGTVVLVNLAALLFVFVPGVNIAAFLVGNAYLLGREYFELAGLRHMRFREVQALRKQSGGRVFLAGLLLAVLAGLPLVNLLLPLFATAFMVHVFKHLSQRASA